MSTHSLRALRDNLGNVVRGVVASGEPAIITDSGTEIAAIVPIGQLPSLKDDTATRHRQVSFLRRFAKERGIQTTSEGLALMGERLRRFDSARRTPGADTA
ncbi:MAG TPA: type II toxin-antitoxin system Phd/YefM family antitoxin [Candidatus Limnocylindrales bacterium]